MKLQQKISKILISFSLLLCLVGCGSSSAINPYDLTDRISSPVAPLSGLTVRFLDVGQGDSALIECDGHYMLIDGGDRKSSSLIYSVLETDEISHLDLIIGTHADEDHIGGLAGALNYATADTTLCSVTEYDTKTFESFKKYADLNGGGIQVPEVGDTYTLGDADVTILAVNSGSSSNDSSIVTRINYGDTSFLFTGDAESETEDFLLNSEYDLTSTVLKVSHHGSKGASSANFINEVYPEYAVISVGADNSYGHPTEEVLERLENVNATVLRTDLSGDITIYSDGTNISVTTERNGNTEAKAETESTTAAESQSSASTYILNIKSKKFHYPTCDSVSKMSEKNKQEYSGTREDLLSDGYSPCGSCNP